MQLGWGGNADQQRLELRCVARWTGDDDGGRKQGTERRFRDGLRRWSQPWQRRLARVYAQSRSRLVSSLFSSYSRFTIRALTLANADAPSSQNTLLDYRIFTSNTRPPSRSYNILQYMDACQYCHYVAKKNPKIRREPCTQSQLCVLGCVWCPHSRIPALNPCPILFKSILLSLAGVAVPLAAVSGVGVTALEPSLLPDRDPAAPTKPDKSPMLGDGAVGAVELPTDVSDRLGFGSMSSSERNEESAKSDLVEVRDKKASSKLF
jgi:hypothetical protein